MFYFLLFFFQVLLCLCGFMVIFSKNPIHSVLFLILVFCNGSGLFVLFGMEFLSLIFLVVYVGAIAVLFLFIVMMLDLKIYSFRQSLLNHYLVSLCFLSIFFIEVFLFFVYDYPFLKFSVNFYENFYIQWVDFFSGTSNVYLLGSLLYTYYFLPFLLSGMILLVAMIGSIILTYSKNEQYVKHQSVFEQIRRENAVIIQ